MKIAGYEFVDGARFQAGANADPTKVGKHLEKLRQKAKGELTPKDVVDDARSKQSPLHSFFEWSDTAAAEQYRLSQARGLIRAVVAIYRSPDQPARKVRAYVHMKESGRSYRDTAEVLSTTKTRAAVLQQAWAEFLSWRRRYQDLSEFATVFAEADRVAATITQSDTAKLKQAS